MRISIDTEEKVLALDDGRRLPLYSKEACEIVSALWLKTSWNQKHSYTFTWFGRPIIQHPEDIVRMQEAIYALTPDVIIETGIAHGGSLIFYASLFKAMDKPVRIVGIDIAIRPHNRQALERHALAESITLIEGNSVSPEVVARAGSAIKPGDKVLVILDSLHTKEHVAAELAAYHRFVTPGSYIVATDGIMESLSDTPLGKADWSWNNPAAAAREFVRAHPDFSIDPPKWLFNESGLERPMTYWPDAWIRRSAAARE